MLLVTSYRRLHDDVHTHHKCYGDDRCIHNTLLADDVCGELLRFLAGRWCHHHRSRMVALMMRLHDAILLLLLRLMMMLMMMLVMVVVVGCIVRNDLVRGPLRVHDWHRNGTDNLMRDALLWATHCSSGRLVGWHLMPRHSSWCHLVPSIKIKRVMFTWAQQT